MRGLEEGKGKLLRRENNNHMLIMFSLQMRRKYANQLRMHKPKEQLYRFAPGACYFLGLGLRFFFFFPPEEEQPQAPSGEGKILSPLLPSTRSFPPLLSLSLPAPRLSCSDLQIQHSGAHPPPPPPPHPGRACFASLRPWDSPERGARPADALRGRADRTSRIRLLRSTDRRTQPKRCSKKCLGKAAEQALNQSARFTVEPEAGISFVNYLTACVREMKYTHRPSPNHRGRGEH